MNNENGEHMKTLRPEEVYIPTSHFDIHKKVGVSSYRVIFIVQLGWKNVLFHFHYSTHGKYLSNSLLSNPHKDLIQKFHPWEINGPTYHFGVHKTISVHDIQRKVVIPFFYCFTEINLSNGVLSGPNKDRTKNLLPSEVDIPTYHFRVHKIVGILFYRFLFKVHYSQSHGSYSFTIFPLSKTFKMVSWATQIEIVCKSYSWGKLT